MNRSVEATGRTIDDAIKQALTMLDADRDEVSVEVLETAKTGLFGLGGSKTTVRVSLTRTQAQRAEEFVTGLLDYINPAAKVHIEETPEGNLDMTLEGEGLGLLIGRRGDTLDAIQHITNFVVNQGEERRVRVTLDTENYRAKREASLERLANKMASKAAKYRRNMTLEPMNAYERHVIHTALQEFPNIKTFSTGTEPTRKVVISYVSGKDKGNGAPPKRERSYR